VGRRALEDGNHRLQILVRGFWHPSGHVGDYYVGHAQAPRAVALHRHAVATADRLGAPDQARGMARYTLACALVADGRADEAIDTLALAADLNPDLRANIARDADLAVLRDAGRLEPLLR
jgi:hypothetical protein